MQLRAWGVGLAVVAMAVGCGGGAPPPQQPPPYYGPQQNSFPPGYVPPQGSRPGYVPQAQPMPQGPVGPPLPAGWEWPVNPQTIARGLTPFTVYRPVNAQALRASRGADRCAPIEVAPSVFVRPLCNSLRPMASSGRTTPRRSMVVRGDTPASVDLRAKGLDGPVKDQQQAGVCWSFAMSSVMDNVLRLAGRQDVMAPLHIIADNEWDMLYSHGKGNPLVTEPAWPYDPHKACKLDEHLANDQYCVKAYGIQGGSWKSDPALVAEKTRAQSSGVFKITAMHTLKSKPGDPNEIATTLSEGLAIWASIDINYTTWGWNNVQNGVIPDWQPDGTGGHAVTIVGYRPGPAGRQFLIKNSWGSSWAERGYAWISETMMRDRLMDALLFDVADAQGNALGKGGGGVLPTPVLPIPGGGGAAPTGECPQGQIKDRIFGQCVAACAGGAPPMAGFCAPGGAPQPQQPQQPQAPAGQCPAGQKPDMLTTQCAATCPNGNARAAGMCW